MDAWETLLDTSTLTPPGFDAWEHLNAQGGGGVPSGTYILSDGLEVSVEERLLEIEIDRTEFEVTIDVAEFEVEIETQEFEVEID